MASLILPDWTWEFHGHRCPFMPIGYRMLVVAMKELGVEHARDHGVFAFVEIGVGHPQTCMADGVKSATGCTYGKLMMERLGYGKMAMILHAPGKGAVRVYLRSEFQDELATQEFFSYRKRGVEPSEIPEAVTQRAVEVVLGATDEKMFKVERVPGRRRRAASLTPESEMESPVASDDSVFAWYSGGPLLLRDESKFAK